MLKRSVALLFCGFLISNIQGQIVYSNQVEGRSLLIKGLLESGIYILRPNNGNHTKLIVK